MSFSRMNSLLALLSLKRPNTALAFFAAIAFCVCASCPAQTKTQTPSPAQTPLDHVPQIRLDRLAAGANVSLWFRYPKSETDDFFANHISDAEAAIMRAMGLSHVRLCVAPKFIMDPATGAIPEARAKFLEAAIRRFHRAGLLVVVDFHNEKHDDELLPEWQEAFVAFWKTLAKRLSTFDPDMTVFEIMNEPVFEKRESEWPPLNARVAAAIRESAPRHTIIVSGPNWGGIDGLLKMKPLADKNIIYSFHCYDPFIFTHQAATWAGEQVKPLRDVPYPSSPESVEPLLAGLEEHPKSKSWLAHYGRERWGREKMAANFQRAIDWGKTHNAPLYCGEFGVFPRRAQPVHRAAWFRDFAQILREHRIPWAVWGWDDAFGLNRKWENGKPVVDTMVAESLGLKP